MYYTKIQFFTWRHLKFHLNSISFDLLIGCYARNVDLKVDILICKIRIRVWHLSKTEWTEVMHEWIVLKDHPDFKILRPNHNFCPLCQLQALQYYYELINKTLSLSSLDFPKAFDKVRHQELLYRLLNYRINTATLTWLKSFLSNRNQQVGLEGAMSDQVPVSLGVTQGSVLGPSLFLAYINDLPQNVKSKDCIQLQPRSP